MYLPCHPVAIESPQTLGDQDMNKDRHRRPLQRRRKWIVILFCTIIDYSWFFPPQAMNIKRTDWVASARGIHLPPKLRGSGQRGIALQSMLRFYEIALHDKLGNIAIKWVTLCGGNNAFYYFWLVVFEGIFIANTHRGRHCNIIN